MDKQDILCKFLISIDLISRKSKQMYQHSIRLHNLYDWTKFIYSCVELRRKKKRERKKEQKVSWNDSTHQSLVLCLHCAYPLGRQRAAPSLFLLLEEKLQRWVPLIPWKAVRQLAVIQRLGNFAQTHKEPPHHAGCPRETIHILFRSGKSTNWAKTSREILVRSNSVMSLKQLFLHKQKH